MKTYSQADFIAWGKEGNAKRNKALTAKQRSAIAKKAARARWRKAKRA